MDSQPQCRREKMLTTMAMTKTHSPPRGPAAASLSYLTRRENQVPRKKEDSDRLCLPSKKPRVNHPRSREIGLDRELAGKRIVRMTMMMMFEMLVIETLVLLMIVLWLMIVLLLMIASLTID